MPPTFEIGVEYTPASPLPAKLSTEDLESLGIKFVRLTWVDLSNVVRFRVISLPYFQKLVKSQRPGVGIGKVVLGIIGLSVAEGFSPVGDYLFVPDLSTIRLCPHEPDHAAVMGIFEEKTPFFDANGSPSVQVQLCPRTALKRVVDFAKQDSAAEFLVGFESEFILLKNTDPIEPVGAYEFSSSASLRSGAQATIVMEKIARAVIASGIELQMYHGEGGAGQYEIVTGPLPPLEAADALVHTREIIYNIAASHGLRATFAPRVFDGIGTAAHAHISVHSHRPGNEKSNKGMSSVEKSFLAGLMQHLPALPALTLPTNASYKRVGDGVWSGGTYVCWGTDTRETPIRLTNATSRTSRRFEMRYIDGTANPYLALAGILGAGQAGICNNLELTVKNCCGPKTAAQMSQDERHALGISSRMPLTWEEGRKNFLADPMMLYILGQELMQGYMSVNKLLSSILEQDPDDESKLLRLINFY